jgi:hypothetical protein
MHVHEHSRFLDAKANDRVLLFLIDKGLQHIEGLRDSALKQLKKTAICVINNC